jgi:hypothetical protein
MSLCGLSNHIPNIIPKNETKSEREERKRKIKLQQNLCNSSEEEEWNKCILNQPLLQPNVSFKHELNNLQKLKEVIQNIIKYNTYRRGK